MGGVDYRKLSIAVIILQIGILYIFTLYYKAPIFYMTLALITSTALECCRIILELESLI